MPLGRRLGILELVLPRQFLSKRLRQIIAGLLLRTVHCMELGVVDHVH